ncbi:fructose-1,6-bisphosphatase [Christensenellaceae bacterium OttesenSCG-928-K19]|nr:fructose-1,6-bisphosphatase [Christensenellaceae bacterium OttesenSCG-928-K19]
MKERLMLDVQKTKYLELLSERYPTIQSACTEIINLKAILNLPKGTEHFVSDIHGEDEAFCHILNNASGVIREKVDILYSKTVSSKTRTELCTLIYYPEQKIKEVRKKKEDMREWYMITLYRMIEVCRLCASKYTRSKVRKALPKDFEYILDELLHTNDESLNKQDYYEKIISTIIDIDRADEFIIALSGVIKRMAVDRLHVVGDIFDRGPHADVILDRLMDHHAVDIQWGNHDVLWMGAAAGSAACIANVLYISTRYGNIDFVENAYGINLRPLALFAQQTYEDNTDVIDHMHKAIAVIQFKLEGQVIARRPEFRMEGRLLLDKIDYDKMTVRIGEREYPLAVGGFPTINPDAPYELSPEEQEVVAQLVYSFSHSEKLQKHVRFLFSHGSMYKIFNGNLLFHGCIPMEEDGSFYEYCDGNITLSGKEFMDYADLAVRQAYYAQGDDPHKQKWQDFVWYLWCGSHSPIFGRDKMTTFERMFVKDEAAWVERKNAYYTLVEEQEICEKILAEFGLDDEYSHIINGHVPVRAKEGEVPVRGGGRLIMIDGGFCRAYQDATGLAGYTMFYSSYGIRLVSHEPFPGLAEAIQSNKDILSTFVVFDTAEKRITVRETDVGSELMASIADLTDLLQAYRRGAVKEKA